LEIGHYIPSKYNLKSYVVTKLLTDECWETNDRRGGQEHVKSFLRWKRQSKIFCTYFY